MALFRSRWLRVNALVGALVILAGCSGGSSRSVATVKTTSPPTAVLHPALPPGTPIPSTVRGCAGSGQHGVTAESLHQALVVGPISLGGLGPELTRRGLESRRRIGGRFLSLEAIAVVKAGSTVVLSVPRAERDRVGLIYNKDKFRNDGLYRVRDLDSVVGFEACRDPAFNGGISQFDGGIVVADRRCFSLDFYIAGDRAKITRRLPIAARC
jgi:hypothetical protein